MVAPLFLVYASHWLFLPPVPTVLADQVTPGWAQYGVLGVVMVAIVWTKALVPGWAYQELKAQNAELRAELKEAKVEGRSLTQQVIDTQATVLPALQTAGAAVDQAMRTIDTIQILERRQSGGPPYRGEDRRLGPEDDHGRYGGNH